MSRVPPFIVMRDIFYMLQVCKDRKCSTEFNDVSLIFGGIAIWYIGIHTNGDYYDCSTTC